MPLKKLPASHEAVKRALFFSTALPSAQVRTPTRGVFTMSPNSNYHLSCQHAFSWHPGMDPYH